MLLLELSSTHLEMIENTFPLIIIKDTRTFLEAYSVELCFPSAICPKNTLPLQNLYFRHSSFEENLTSSEDDSEFKRHPRFVESLNASDVISLNSIVIEYCVCSFQDSILQLNGVRIASQ